MKYVLTGATGGLGSRVFDHLLNIVPASDVIVSLYNPSGATPTILQSGVEIRKGNFSDPQTLDTAFSGADKLLIVSYPSMAHQLRVKNHVAAIDAAKRVGVKHVYYTSLAFAGDSKAAVMQAHIDTEKYLKESGLKYTIIKEGIYNESYPLYFGYFDPAEGKDEVLVPYSDGAIAWACRDDLGEGTAKIMAAESGYDNTTVLLSGSEAVTLTALASKISSILPGNRNITLKVVSLDEFIEHNKGKQPEDLLRAWSTTWTALGRGELAVVDPLLETLLGRKTKSIDETLKEVLGADGSGSAHETSKYSRTTA
ncbi:NmrA-like family protein [Cristinia sonorae]|uniref:NmrA-like family protein n=1 Tax=Cristinia sonorae TaxID=1940300 RepID=A0A8K0UGC4_9AGAR|nr:NmrA-like family protein [Cristinia sonorae]